ncbi:MAG: VWA domain-containing protein [Gemmataceae bacterium]|nr:VWA domain-containing protein [Gemmataceae bacterium]
MSDLNAVDLAFVVDTTGSMGNLIGAAQKQMIDLIEGVSRAADIDLRLGVVEYRDHPPQDQMVYRAYPFTANLKTARATINQLAAAGGGDGPESVLDGVLAACRELKWRAHALRLAVLVGDSPPHGVGSAGDGFPKGCPCGQTIDSVTAAVEEARVTLYALGLTACATDSFGRLARATGGEFFAAEQAEAALKRLQEILAAEFRELEFDRRVLAERQASPALPLADLAARLESSRPAVSRAVSRLGARGLLG